MQEMMHKFKNVNGKKGFVAWKVDLSKAYDRLSWDSIMGVIREIGVDGKIAKIIDQCIRSVKYIVSLNGEVSDEFVPGYGIRQGDPFLLIFLFWLWKN